jgi:hypothetical protein
MPRPTLPEWCLTFGLSVIALAISAPMRCGTPHVLDLIDAGGQYGGPLAEVFVVGEDKSLPRGRIKRTLPLAGFTARAAGGRLLTGIREKAGNDGAGAT